MNRILAVALALIAFAAPLVAESSIAQGTALFEQMKFKEAETVFQAVSRTSPKDPAAPFWLGRVAMALDDRIAAATQFEKAVALNPRNSEYRLWLGRAYGAQALRANVLKQASLARKVKGEFEMAVKLDPANLDARSALVDFYSMAPGIMGGGIDKAKAEAAEIAKRDSVRGARELAKIHRNEKEWPEAERVLAAAINKNPANMALRRDLGYIYQQTEEWAKAYSTFSAVVVADPNDMVALYQIGRLAVMSGTYLEQGEQALQKYLEYTPKGDEPPLKWAHLRLGAIYEKEKRADLARAQYQLALKLDPQFKEAKEASNRIR